MKSKQEMSPCFFFFFFGHLHKVCKAVAVLYGGSSTHRHTRTCVCAPLLFGNKSLVYSTKALCLFKSTLNSNSGSVSLREFSKS